MYTLLLAWEKNTDGKTGLFALLFLYIAMCLIKKMA